MVTTTLVKATLPSLVTTPENTKSWPGAGGLVGAATLIPTFGVTVTAQVWVTVVLTPTPQMLAAVAVKTSLTLHTLVGVTNWPVKIVPVPGANCATVATG